MKFTVVAEISKPFRILHHFLLLLSPFLFIRSFPTVRWREFSTRIHPTPLSPQRMEPRIRGLGLVGFFIFFFDLLVVELLACRGQSKPFFAIFCFESFVFCFCFKCFLTCLPQLQACDRCGSRGASVRQESSGYEGGRPTQSHGELHGTHQVRFYCLHLVCVCTPWFGCVSMFGLTHYKWGISWMMNTNSSILTIFVSFSFYLNSLVQESLGESQGGGQRRRLPSHTCAVAPIQHHTPW